MRVIIIIIIIAHMNISCVMFKLLMQRESEEN